MNELTEIDESKKSDYDIDCSFLYYAFKGDFEGTKRIFKNYMIEKNTISDTLAIVIVSKKPDRKIINYLMSKLESTEENNILIEDKKIVDNKSSFFKTPASDLVTQDQGKTFISFSAKQIVSILEYIVKLEKEANTWYSGNPGSEEFKTRSQKMNAFAHMIVESKSGKPISEIVDNTIAKFPAVKKGLISHRALDILNALKEDSNDQKNEMNYHKFK